MNGLETMVILGAVIGLLLIARDMWMRDEREQMEAEDRKAMAEWHELVEELRPWRQ